MPWRCCVPGCKGYDEAKSLGVIFHGLPTRDPPRCRAWLRAIRNPRFDERTPAARYGGVRVCSLHFQPDDYEEDFRAKILKVAPKPALKSGAVPSVFPGRGRAEPAGADAHAPPGAPERSSAHAPPGAPERSSAQATGGAAGSSSQPPPAAEEEEEESFCIVVSVDPRDDELNATTSDEDEDEDEAGVSGRSLLQLFRRCQACGQPMADAQLLHAGARVTVRWRCDGGHAGLWDSNPRPGDDPRP